MNDKFEIWEAVEQFDLLARLDYSFVFAIRYNSTQTSFRCILVFRGKCETTYVMDWRAGKTYTLKLNDAITTHTQCMMHEYGKEYIYQVLFTE